MPLVVSSLEASLLRLATTAQPSSRVQAANEFVSAFYSYASSATAGAFPLIAPGPGAAAMAAPLVAAYNVGLAPVVAQALGAAVAAYWSAALFAFAPAPGIAAPPAGVPVLITAATNILLNKNNTAQAYASQIAAAIDACSKTVLVTFVPPPPAVPFVLSVM